MISYGRRLRGGRNGQKTPPLAKDLSARGVSKPQRGHYSLYETIVKCQVGELYGGGLHDKRSGGV